MGNIIDKGIWTLPVAIPRKIPVMTQRRGPEIERDAIFVEISDAMNI